LKVNTRSRRWLSLCAVLLTAALFATACGDDSDSSSTATTPPATGSSGSGSTAGSGSSGGSGSGSAGGLVAGCANGYTDPADLSLTRKVARCDKGAPAPKPLATKTKVKVTSAFKLEFMSPILLGMSMGEFEKENLDIEFINLPFSDAAAQLASGAVDVAVGGFEIALFAAGNSDRPVKAVLANYYPPHAGDYTVPQTGLWCRRDSFTTPANPVLKEIEKLKWASSVGKGSSGIYYSAAELKKKVPDLNIKQTVIDRVPSADTVAALKNKAIDCGVLLDPVWSQVATDPAFFQAATQTPGEPLGLYAYGKSFLQDKPEVGVAFARAFIRTVNTYYQGDYHKDAAVMAEIAKTTGQPMTALTAVDSLVMDWEIRKDTTTRIQQLFIDLGVIVDWKTPVAEDKLVDRSFYMKAVGKS
jgi:NitT/TauT family transport system substrate-binding protein